MLTISKRDDFRPSDPQIKSEFFGTVLQHDVLYLLTEKNDLAIGDSHRKT